MGMKHQKFEDEAPENWNGEDHDELEETDYASLITNHMNLVQTIPLEKAVHDTILPIQMDSISTSTQFNKMKLEIIESANARREKDNSKPNTSGVRSMNRSVMAREPNRQAKPLGEFVA